MVPFAYWVKWQPATVHLQVATSGKLPAVQQLVLRQQGLVRLQVMLTPYY